MAAPSQDGGAKPPALLPWSMPATGSARATEYMSQVPAAARTGVVQSPSTYTTTPLGQPRPVPQGPTPAVKLPGVPQVVPQPLAPQSPWKLPSPQVAVPHGAAPVVEPERPPGKPPKPDKKSKPDRKGNRLEDYSYERSLPELNRVREEQPLAESTVSVSSKAVPLTWEAYDKLTPDQRAAVDFNTVLVDSREADLRFVKPLEGEALKQYNLDVESIFGKGGGSDIQAPATIKLLKKINFTAVGQDLDEFLSLERGVSAKELKDFEFSKADLKQLASFTGVGPVSPQSATEYAGVRSAENLAVVDTKAIQSALDTYKTRAATSPIPLDMRALIGTGDGFGPYKIPAGYGTADRDKAFAASYELLKQYPDKSGVSQLLADFKDRNWTPEDQQALWNYLDERTRRDVQMQGDTTSAQVRRLLGWE